MQPLPSQNLAAHKEALKQIYENSVAAVAVDLLGFRDVCPETHGAMIKTLEHPNKRKLIVAPRGSLKTSVCVVAYGLNRILRNRDLRILIMSEVYTNSKNLIREIRGAVESRKFVELYGDLRGPQWGEGEITFAGRSKVFKEASITAGAIGTVKVGQHYDLILLDDVNSNKNSDTPEKCQKVYDFYRYLTSILEPDGEMMVVGTRYSAADLIQRILTDECGVKEISEIEQHNQKILGGLFK
jgi:hypothetical protein